MDKIERRTFITLLSSAAAWPHGVIAQQPDRPRRVGALLAIAENDPTAQPRIAVLQQALESRGWIIGRNLQIDYRWSAGNVSQFRAYAKELVALQPDVIIAHTTSAVVALHQETRAIPIVFIMIADPVNQKLVASLAHPGGNITGFTFIDPHTVVKWLELLTEIAPRVSRIALLFNPTTMLTFYLHQLESSARSRSVDMIAASVYDPAEIENAMAAHAREPNAGLVVPPDSFTTVHRQLIIRLAARHRLPAIYGLPYMVPEGGLMAYGLDVMDQFRRAADYADRILKGTTPADLPVQQPTKFQFLINLKTANALGLNVPRILLARADEVFE
jgi:putative ABC transport system substrate-binding protein